MHFSANQEISCSEGEDGAWTDHTQRCSVSDEYIVPIEIEKKCEESIERRQLRKRRPEQKRPYTYDLLRHNEEFRKVGIRPMKSGFSGYLSSDSSDFQYTSQDSEKSCISMTHTDSESQDSEVFKWLKPNAKFINPNRYSWHLKGKKSFQKRVLSSPANSKEMSHISNYNSDTMITTKTKPFHSSNEMPKLEDKENDSQNSISNTSVLSLDSYSIIPVKRNSKTRYILQSSTDTEKSDFSYKERNFMDDISHYKKKLKGILPPSYLTLESRFIISNRYSERYKPSEKNTIQQENRKGLVKKKIAKSSSISKFLLTDLNLGNSGGYSKKTEDSNPILNHNYYSSNQSSDDNVALKKNVINKNYTKTEAFYKHLNFKKRYRKNNAYKKSSEKFLEYMLPKKKGKRKLNNSLQRIKIKKNPAIKIGILDILKEHKDRNDQPFPKFINLACRIMKSRNDLGRIYPYNKFFFFDNFQDRQEISEIFRKWKQGTLAPLYLKNDIFSSYSKPKVTADSICFQGKNPSVLIKKYGMEENVEKSNKYSKKILGKMFLQRGVQTKLTDNFIKKSNEFYNRKGRNRNYNVAKVFESIYSWLNKISSESNVSKTDANIENLRKSDIISALKGRRNIRKQIAKRVDPNRFDDTIIHRHVDNINMQNKNINLLQQSLEQFWLKKSTFSMSFNVNPIKQDIFFNSETFIGNGLLQKLLESDDNADESLHYIECYTIFDYEIKNDLSSDIKKIQKIFEKLSYNVLKYNIQGFKEKNIIDSSLYSFLFYLFRYITFWLQSDTSGLLIDFSKDLLELCENLSEQLIPSVQFSENLSLRSPSVKFFFELQMFFLIFSFKFMKLYFTKNDTSKFYNLCGTIMNVSQRLIKYLLKFGFDFLNSELKKQNNLKYSLKGIGNDCYFIEVWIVTIRIADFSSTLFNQSISNFWSLLNSELKITDLEIYEFLDHEKCWYSIMNLVMLYQFNVSGISCFPNGPDNWIMIEKILSNFFENIEVYNKELGNSRDAYVRTLFGRCHYFISTWKWSYARSIVILLYTFFSKRQLRNLPSENTIGYPRFIQNLDIDPSTSIETYDTCFHIFLKLIILVIEQFKIQLDNSFISSKDLKNLMSRITPLHNRKYSNDQELSIEDFISLENHHSLLLTLFRIVPVQYRPPIVMIQDLLQIENAHCKARLVNIKAWFYLTRFLLYNSNNDEFQAACNWYDLVLDATREEYLSIYRSYKSQLDFKTLKYFSNSKLLKYNLKQLENVMISCLSYKKEIIDLKDNINKEKILQLFSKASSINLFNFSSIIPSSVIIEALNLTCNFIRQLCGKFSCEKHNELHVDDSQDYGDISIFYDLIDNCDFENNIERRFSMIINETLSGQIFQMLSNYLGSDIEISYELLNAVIECWVLTADLLVRNRIKEWSNYLDYGQESWIRFGNNSKINQAGVIFMSKIIQECPDAYFAYRVTFISYWFRVIVEDKLYNQHILTSHILNIDSCNKLWNNPPFIKKSDVFEIQLSEIKLYQFSIISNTLANMGEIYSHLESENLLQITKSEFLTYLSNLFHSMRDNYQMLVRKNNNDLGKYIDLCQKLIGCVLQYCGEFVNENSLPILEWFTNSTNFPQPEEDIVYTAKKLKGYGRRNLFNPSIQEELFRFIKTKCEEALFENKRSQFSILMCLILKGDNNLDIETQTVNLVSFILDEIFSTYITYSKIHITWIYIIPMLEATKELMANFLEYKCQDSDICSILNIMQSFFHVLLSCLKTFFESSTLLAIYGSVKIFEILSILVKFLESLNYTNCSKNMHLYVFGDKDIKHLWQYVSKFLKLVPIFISWISSGKNDVDWPDLCIIEVQKKQLGTIQRQIYREWTLKESQTEYIWIHNFRNQEIKLISGFSEKKIKMLLLKGIFNFVACLFACGGVQELYVKEIIPSILLKGLLIDHNVIIEFMASIGKLHEFDNIDKNKYFIPNNVQIKQHFDSFNYILNVDLNDY
ncbi:hypothetical protein PORY_002530 [Pneumocystis oryctolagi]|uniref:Uncharacterized protein n=1 Tax=Pneumocystis oryctolagi TaxID=42067 RepID=A0ACB7C8J9_9ASCO|nr:hypothetical protein PORY_002530 [Pneumocystis oryctolagi]